MNKELNLTEIHEATLEVLKKLIEICDRIEINYFLGYGSLLGAVRNHGFIPWDDDFDVLMKRQDYEKFIAYCAHNKDLIAPFEILDYRYNSEYPYPIARFSDTRFKAVFEGMKQYDCGTFIDLYPLDGIGDGTEKTRKKINQKKLHLKKMNRFSYLNKDSVDAEKGLKRIVKQLIVNYCSKKGSQYYCKKLNDLGYLFDGIQNKYLGVIVWNDKPLICHKEAFDNYLLVDFEGIKVKIPSGYDEVLTTYYGDYMKLPPVNQQIPHHEYQLFKKDI